MEQLLLLRGHVRDAAGAADRTVQSEQTEPGAGALPRYASRDELRDPDHVVQPGPAQDPLRAGHGGALPGDDAAARDGTAQGYHPYLLRHDAVRVLLATPSGRGLQRH